MLCSHSLSHNRGISHSPLQLAHTNTHCVCFSTQLGLGDYNNENILKCIDLPSYLFNSLMLWRLWQFQIKQNEWKKMKMPFERKKTVDKILTIFPFLCCRYRSRPAQSQAYAQPHAYTYVWKCFYFDANVLWISWY